MILVVVGISRLPFDRLLGALHALSADERLVIQSGVSSGGPAHAEYFGYLPFNDLVALITRARVVVTHAGVGSMMTTLAEGKRPIVVPRLKRFGEAVDDHQLVLARRLAREGVVTVVEDIADLAGAIAAADTSPAFAVTPDERLVTELRGYIDDVISERDHHAPR